MKVRLSRKNLAVYPNKVAAKIRIIAEQFSILTFEQKDELPTRIFYACDNLAYYGMQADGAEYDFEAAKKLELGDWLSKAVGNKFKMPAGSWLVLVSRLHDGSYLMTVYHIIEDAKEQERLKRDQALPLDNVRMRLGCGFK